MAKFLVIKSKDGVVSLVETTVAKSFAAAEELSKKQAEENPDFVFAVVKILDRTVSSTSL